MTEPGTSVVAPDTAESTLALAKDVLRGKPMPLHVPDQVEAVEQHLKDFLTRRGQVRVLRNFAAARAEEGNPIDQLTLNLHEGVIMGQWKDVSPGLEESKLVQAEDNARAVLTGGEPTPVKTIPLPSPYPVRPERSGDMYRSWGEYIEAARGGGTPFGMSDAEVAEFEKTERAARREEAVQAARKLLEGGARVGSAELLLFPSDILGVAQARIAAEEQKHTTPEALARRSALVRWGTDHPDDPFPFEFTKEEGEEAAKTLEAIRDGLMVAPWVVLDAQNLYTQTKYGARIEVEVAHQVGIERMLTTLEWGVCFLAGGMTEALAPALVRVLGISIHTARAVSLFVIFEGLSLARQGKEAALRGDRPTKQGDDRLRAFAAWREALWNLIFSLPSSATVAVVGMVMNIVTEVFVDEIAEAVYEGLPRLSGWAADQAKRITRAVVKLRLHDAIVAMNAQQGH